jgi:hypothetical protein
MITTHALTSALINLTERDTVRKDPAPKEAVHTEAPKASATVPQSTETAPHPGRTECISPYLNPAHILAPPRAWVDAVSDGSISWEFFRLRYKNLLRARLRDDPEPFFALLEEAGHSGRELTLTCHCLTGPCHAEVAWEFLDRLREQETYQRWVEMRRQVTLFPLPLHHASTVTR